MTRTIVIECEHCSGTGLTEGLYPREGVGFECKHCNGTGKIDFTYNEFEGRKEADNVTRVFDGNFENYVHYANDIEASADYFHSCDSDILHFSRFGCSYADWKNGIKPKPMEELYCPYEAYGSAPCKGCKFGSNPTKCKSYPKKELCWYEYHNKSNA